MTIYYYFRFFFLIPVNMKKFEKAHGSFERALDYAKSLGMNFLNVHVDANNI